jgi:hypothetical protein
MESLGLIEKIKGFLFHPTETYKKIKEEPFKECFTYFAILMVIYSALYALMIVATMETFWGSLFTVYKNLPVFKELFSSGGTVALIGLFFMMFFISGLIGVFFSGGIIHLGVLMFGGKRGYLETVKALIYAETPVFMFAWIPIVGLLFAIWTFILDIFGIKELQDLSIGKAIAAIIIPILIFAIIIVVIVAVFVFAYVTSLFAGLPS